MKIAFIFLFLIILSSFAYADKGLLMFGLGSSSGSIAVTNFILLSDGSSKLLQIDGTSKVCLAGGC